MSSISEIASVKEYLEQQFIVVSSEWVEACISFIKAEHNQNITLTNLKNFVYQQWLNADLDEIGTCTFGANCGELVTSQKITLTGCFALQVDGIKDVGRPAYSQLKDLEQVANANAEFSAAPPPSLPPWEAKPTRMLLLHLTDGCSHFQGMEYQPINFLSPNLPPGIKVLIQGPIDCRFGMLLLTPEKIKILGGEVEEKQNHLSRIAILRQTLQLPAEDDIEVASSSNINSEDALQASNNQRLQHATFTNETNHLRQPSQTNISFSEQPDSTRSQSITETFGNNNTRQNTGHEIHSDASFIRQHASSDPCIFTSRVQEQISSESLDNLDVFEDEDDDFDLSLDHGVLDELERESLSKSQSMETPMENNDIWLADEDVVEDMMAFQDEHPGFEMPFIPKDEQDSNSPLRDIQSNKPFVYLSSVLKNSSPDCIVTIKGFILTVLSKLECTVDKGWHLMVKINDGTASLDVIIHDKVLENIIGISASTMMQMQVQAAGDPEKRKEVMQAISKCKVSLQDYNFLMDIKFTPGLKPCLVKCYPITNLDIQQLLQRVQSTS